MYLPRFLNLRPSSLDEAVKLLGQNGKNVSLIAGGTELLPRMKYGLCSPEVIISLKGMKISSPQVTDEGMLILDAHMSLTSIIDSPEIYQKAPLLAMAAGKVATREIRNMGTLGGNLCQETRCLYFNQKHTFQFREPCFKRGGKECYFIPKGNKCWAVFMSDLAPALLSLDASINIVGGDGERQMKIDELYTHDPLNPISLKPDEILTTVMISGKPNPSGSGFAKFTMRDAIEFAGVNVGVFLEAENDLCTCKRARITVGAISEAPQRMPAVETSLEGKRLSEKNINVAAQKIAETLKIVPHHGYSKGYLVECLKIQTKTALIDAVNAITGAKQYGRKQNGHKK